MTDHSELTGPRVAILAYDGLCTFEFGVAQEAFGLARPEMGKNWYRCQTVAVEQGPLRAAGGLRFTTDVGLDQLQQADLIVVPGWRGIDAPVPDPLIEALRQASKRGARIMSLCSGITVLAASGLLDGRRATTHWRYADAIATRYPAISLDPDVLYIDEGEVLTAAGSAAGIDLCLHVIRRDFGTKAANSVARRLVVPPHRDGGQAQFIERPVARDGETGRLGPLIDWVQSNLDRPLALAELANRAGMSERTLQRRIQEMTGQSIGDWLIGLKVSHACHLLADQKNAPLEAIAAASGFGSAATMRHHFRARLATSPGAYRRRFAGLR
ncbi:transcriptional regulator FtrA [Peteryoungia desertarenae]|uniref:Transcriptional regulator FtrA n=1 Tax=Peteryoungia desertarenae TaxID=1813451 RepID=A0ABX6QKL3_9HYPH|nr:transcriptional regulator FtrA [Peteryoungia desertarenae]QLF68760.1 transcriptional regulator FtrA [Peteryoungia desertarenae]